MTTPTSPRPSRLRASLTIGLMIAISIGLLLVDFRHFGQYGYLGVFVLVLLGNATVVVPAPAFMTALAAGRTLNPWLVGVISGLGAGIGEVTGYIAGRAGRSVFDQQQRFTRIQGYVERWGAFAIFALAALPNPLMDFAGIAAGIARMPVYKFLLACCAGKIVRFTILALIGQSTM
ncbi:VTT domain-containing protein [Herpetosiphon giganteus]|uniref:VTT domain-containing protein n=1 Tax=Herpetosiphon giganteus TaxID=2029754 RepID=UPI0019589FA8|nr:VTT domain-containing protein [Herpetosiphon giganteus]MBM7841793.1 membrane protein YqaA with SNARE-associated domain [Herpetosiphon giganteus]